MHTLATIFRAAQFYAHNAHNLAFGPSSLADHKFFKGAYEDYTDAYDDLIERMIGLGEDVNPAFITDAAAEMVVNLPAFESDDGAFTQLLEFERQICSEIAMNNSSNDITLGTQNLLQGLADESEKRQYKIQQRLKS